MVGNGHPRWMTVTASPATAARDRTRPTARLVHSPRLTCGYVVQARPAVPGLQRPAPTSPPAQGDGPPSRRTPCRHEGSAAHRAHRCQWSGPRSSSVGAPHTAHRARRHLYGGGTGGRAHTRVLSRAHGFGALAASRSASRQLPSIGAHFSTTCDLFHTTHPRRRGGQRLRCTPPGSLSVTGCGPRARSGRESSGSQSGGGELGACRGDRRPKDSRCVEALSATRAAGPVIDSGPSRCSAPQRSHTSQT